MTENASPFFIRPHRFDDPEPDDAFPRLDRHRQLVLDTGEELLWRDRVDVAGYLLAVRPDADELSWTLPRPAEVTVTDRRLAYVCTDWGIGGARARNAGPRHLRRPLPAGGRVATGQVRWQWPSALRVLPAAAATGPAGASPERLLIVCDAMRVTGQPSLGLSGGALQSPRAVRGLAGLIRRAVAGFRLANPATVELSPPERDALLARAGVAVFADAIADPRRGVDLPGALPVEFSHRDDYYRRSPVRVRPTGAGRWKTPPSTRWSSGQPGSAS